MHTKLTKYTMNHQRCTADQHDANHFEWKTTRRMGWKMVQNMFTTAPSFWVMRVQSLFRMHYSSPFRSVRKVICTDINITADWLTTSWWKKGRNRLKRRRIDDIGGKRGRPIDLERHRVNFSFSLALFVRISAEAYGGRRCRTEKGKKKWNIARQSLRLVGQQPLA